MACHGKTVAVYRAWPSGIPTRLYGGLEATVTAAMSTYYVQNVGYQLSCYTWPMAVRARNTYRIPWDLVLVLRGTQLPTPARLYTRGILRVWGIVLMYSHHIGSKNLRISRLIVLSSECECRKRKKETGGCRGLYVAAVGANQIWLRGVKRQLYKYE